MNKFVFTCGDPNGIGPEIVIKTINSVYNKHDDFILVIPKDIFNNASSLITPDFNYEFYSKKNSPRNKTDHVKIIDFRGGKLNFGNPTKTSGKISFTSLQIASKLAQDYNYALITAPISKKAWQYNSLYYEGHTDYFGELFSIKNPLMLFYSKKIIAALATIHIPIQKVAPSLNKRKLRSIISDLHKSMVRDFKLNEPKIAVLGLNPHAGETGRIGKEELNIIIPVIEKSEYDLKGPFVPDAFFGKHEYKNFDAVLGMYHDQVLIPFKMLDFKSGVNFTANLPIVRTSPDHGTAFDIAYKGIAEPSSMIAAFTLAKRILKNRHIK